MRQESNALPSEAGNLRFLGTNATMPSDHRCHNACKVPLKNRLIGLALLEAQLGIIGCKCGPGAREPATIVIIITILLC